MRIAERFVTEADTTLMTDHNDVTSNLSSPTTIHFPARFRLYHRNATRVQLLGELSKMGATFSRGAEAMRGLYYQIADMIRRHDFSDSEVREALKQHFPEQRISELLRVARAPQEVFNKYELKLIGFRAALKEAREFTLPKTEARTKRQLRRSAERLVAFVRKSGQSVVSIYVAGCSVEVKPEREREVNAA